jgi:hypothetical protein
MLRRTIEPLTKGRVMADEDDVIEVVEEVEVDVVMDDEGNPVGAVVDDVIVASGPGGVVIDETIDVLDADGNIVAESETIEVIETGD